MPPAPNPAAAVPGLVPPPPDVNAVPQFGLDGAEVSPLPLPKKALGYLTQVKIHRQMTWRRCGQGLR